MLKIFRDSGDASILGLPSRASYDFHSSFGNFLSDGNAIGNAHQIGVFELHPRTLVAVVE